MSRSRRRGSKDLPEDEPEPVAEASEEQRHTSAARESTLVAATSQHSLLEENEVGDVASHEFQPSSQRTLRDQSGDPPKENFEEASLELDPATSSSPPKLSRRRSKDPPEESHAEFPEEHATPSAPSPHKTRRRRSKDLPDEEEEKSSMPPPLESGAVSSSSHPRYLESSVEAIASQLPATTELRQLACISVGKELALGHEVEARIAFVEGDRVYYDIGDRGRVSGNFFIDEADGIKKFLVTWYRSGLTSTMHAESWRDSLDIVGMLLKDAPEQQDELEVLPGVKLEVDGEEYYSAGDVGLVIDEASIDEKDGIKRFPVAWYRTGLTCRVKTEDWMKQFRLVGDPPANEAMRNVKTYMNLPSMEDTLGANAAADTEQELPALEDTLRATAAVTTNSEDSDARLALMDMDRMDETPLQIPDSPNFQAIEDLPLDVQENNEVQALEDLPLDVRENSDVQVPSTGDSQVRRGSMLQRLFRKAKPGAITGVPQQGVQLQEGDNQLEDQDDDEDSADGVLTVEDPYSSAAKSSGYGDDDLSDIESDLGAGREPLPRMGTKKSTFNFTDEEDEFAKMVEINNFNMLCSICASVAWVFGAAGTLLALTLHYVWVEVTQLTETSARAAAEHGCLHSSEVLRSTLILMRTMDLGFRMGSIASIWTNVTSNPNNESTFDYIGYKKVVEPFFKVLPGLREVELVDTPEDPVVGVAPGSIVAARSSLGEVEIRSDRGDCIAVPGRHGCTLESQLANSSSWYEDCRNMYPHYWSANPIQGLWTGPAFSRDLPHEAICDELCWSPTFSLTARISGTVDPRTVGFAGSYSQYRSFVARVTLEATVFVDILRTVQVQSRGEAVICTNDGTVVAAVDMASAQFADAMSGDVGMVKIWDFPRNWSSAIKPALVDSASGDSIIEGGYLVSAWRLDSPFQPNLTGVMDSLGDKLRLVIAIHQDAFADAMIHSLRFWFIVVSALPVAFVVVMVIVNLYSRFCVPNKMKPQDLTFEEMQRAARRSRLSRASRRPSRAWTMESSMTKNKLGARLTKKMAFMKSRSLGMGQNNRKEMNFNQKPSLPSQFSYAPSSKFSNAPSSNMKAITNQAR